MRTRPKIPSEIGVIAHCLAFVILRQSCFRLPISIHSCLYRSNCTSVPLTIFTSVHISLLKATIKSGCSSTSSLLTNQTLCPMIPLAMQLASELVWLTGFIRLSGSRARLMIFIVLIVSGPSSFRRYYAKAISTNMPTFEQ